jgi:hypothetical protein
MVIARVASLYYYGYGILNTEILECVVAERLGAF